MRIVRWASSEAIVRRMRSGLRVADTSIFTFWAHRFGEVVLRDQRGIARSLASGFIRQPGGWDAQRQAILSLDLRRKPIRPTGDLKLPDPLRSHGQVRGTLRSTKSIKLGIPGT